MHQDPRRLDSLMFALSVMGSLMLIVIGLVFTCAHDFAASAYGVELSGGATNAWISAAAWRDIAFGVLALSFALLRDRRAMGLTLLFGTIIPIGDAAIVLQNNPTPWLHLPLHVGGAIGCLILAAILLKPRKS